jgi:CRP-like cAMP-binding protein
MPRPFPTSLVRFCRSLPIFGGLEGRSLNHVLHRLQEHNYASGATIFSKGEMGRTMYVLRQGEVDVLCRANNGQVMPLVRLGPGECFGEMALVELQPRSATILVRKKAKVFSLNNIDLYTLYREDNYAYVIVLQNICRMISRRLRKADSRIADFLAASGAPAGQRAPKGRKRRAG